ncbi:MAG TPA: hypothetical protein VIW64_00105 [Pyrinomonadaceae bacterium]|jgi:hypothetical protein
MRWRRVSAVLFYGSLLSFAVFLAGCATNNKPLVEKAPSAAPSPASEPVVSISKPSPPEINSVNAAVKRVFKDAAVVDTSRTLSFVDGDFNGDRSQDIAVVIKPEPDRLAAMNEEYPAWMLRDPFGTMQAKSPRLRIAADDVLLAIIHGYGPEGWRDSQATQTFLLKNAAGSTMKTHPLKDFVAANQDKKLPPLRGDLLGESIGDKSGYFYFADATYAWYDPKTFNGQPPPRRGHGDQKLKQ